jgi:hypothetical protein
VAGVAGRPPANERLIAVEQAFRSLPDRYLGADPRFDEIYDHLMALIQESLDALAAERRFPVIG